MESGGGYSEVFKESVPDKEKNNQMSLLLGDDVVCYKGAATVDGE